jgi:histidinol-phosphatase (PHP family)
MKKKYHFDFIIGSIHYLGQFPDGTYWTIDGSFGEFEKGLATVFNGDIKAVVQGYYALVKEMVTHYPPDIIGHLDLIKMHNRDNRFFSDTEDWYRQAVWETLQVIAASPCVVEMNTGGLARQRANDFYPTGWILAECARLGIPLTISSDAHKPDQLTGFFPEALSCLQKLDSPKLVRLSPDGWKNTSSSEPGYK